MKRYLGVVLAVVLLPSQAAELGVHHAESVFDDDKPLALTQVRWGMPLPWRWSLVGDWTVSTGLDVVLGRLRGNGDSSTAVGVGPALRMGPPSGRWYVGLSWRPTYLSRSTFGDLDLGGNIQFESALGAGYWLSEHVSVSYELLHISNGGLDDRNPGWNGQRLGLSYGF
ncbi:MAG: acyloxyacyl hydrolase [Pseudomonadota bacterium]